MKRFTILLVLLASMAVSACSTMQVSSTLGKTPPPNQVGNGEYFVATWPGNVPHVDPNAPGNQPAVYGLNEFDQLAYFDSVCRVQMKPQVPSALKSEGTTTLRTAIPLAISGRIGTGEGIKAVTKMTKGYPTYGAWSAGSSGVAAGIAGGIDRHLTSNRYALGECMNALVAQGKKDVGILPGFHIILNADAVNGTPIKRPMGSASATPVKYKPDPTAEPDDTTHR